MTKDSVLAVLRRKNGFVSGETISVSLGVSRAAVNAAVKALRADGYDIASSTNRGYCILNAPDRLTTGEMAAYLPDDRLRSVQCLDTADSTNRRIQALAFGGAPDGTVVLADEQTEGRGRLGRTFTSPQGKGIYLSMLLRPQGTPAGMTAVTACAAVAVCRAVERVCGVHPGIKWVNDLILNGRKVCGILTEMSVEGESGRIQHVILGIGLNVLEEPGDFPEELRSVATSLQMETGRAFSRAALAAEMIRELDSLRGDWPAGVPDALKAYRANSLTVGREVEVSSPSGAWRGRAVQIADDFSLEIRRENGVCEQVRSGEVSVRGIGGCAG